MNVPLLPILHAKSRAQKDEDVSADDDGDDEAPDKKDKPGFRDRKVSALFWSGAIVPVRSATKAQLDTHAVAFSKRSQVKIHDSTSHDLTERRCLLSFNVSTSDHRVRESNTPVLNSR